MRVFLVISFCVISGVCFAGAKKSLHMKEANKIDSCTLSVSENSKVINYEIQPGVPGANLNNAAYCNSSGMHIYKKFKISDNSTWILSLYADRDKNKNTHFVHRIYESGTSEPPQIDLVLNQLPCTFLKSDGTGISAQLKSKEGNAFKLKLTCKKR